MEDTKHPNEFSFSIMGAGTKEEVKIALNNAIKTIEVTDIESLQKGIDDEGSTSILTSGTYEDYVGEDE